MGRRANSLSIAARLFDLVITQTSCNRAICVTWPHPMPSSDPWPGSHAYAEARTFAIYLDGIGMKLPNMIFSQAARSRHLASCEIKMGIPWRDGYIPRNE